MTAVYIFLAVVLALAVLVALTPWIMSEYPADSDNDADDHAVEQIKAATQPAELRPHVRAGSTWNGELQ